MSKTIVLLDVDETIWFQSHSDALNQELIERLIQLGAIDIFLFTDMTLKNEHIKHRENLIKTLRDKGLRIHGVITPSDLFWNDDSISTNNASSEETARQHISASFLNSKLGIAYNSALIEFQKQGVVSSDTYKKSYHIAREIIPFFTEIFQYPHLKGLLFDFFLKHLPANIKKIIVIDDRPSVLKSVRLVYTYQWKFLETNNLTIDTIYVSQKNRGIYYSMESARKWSPESSQRRDIINVEKEISRLRISSIFFNESRQQKANRIECALYDAMHLGCEDVTQDPLLRKELAHHRIFSFWGLKKANSLINIDSTSVVTSSKII